MLNIWIMKNEVFTLTGIFCLLISVSTVFFVVEQAKPQVQLNELKLRVNSWWLMYVGFGIATLSHPLTFLATVAFLSFVAFREMYSMLDFRQEDRMMIWMGYLSIPLQYFWIYQGWYFSFLIFIPLGMFLFIPLQYLIKGMSTQIIKSMSMLHWMLMLTVFGLSHLAYLMASPGLDNFDNQGVGLIFFLVILTEMNDVFQFIWGKLFGKNQIAPKISPNKTWEGFVGGVLSTCALGLGLSFLIPFSLWLAVLLSLVIAVSGFFGDLLMSAIKRDLGLKDTGKSIPGHGGVLDRLDSLLYTAPVFFHLVNFIL